MANIIVTGFEPFGGSTINASWEGVKALPDQIGDYTVRKIQLPVVFNQAAEKLFAEATAIDPLIILCVGEASGRAEITPELFAHNIQYASIADNQGQMPRGRRCVEEGQVAIESRQPVWDQAEAIRAAGLPARVSTTAGTYVCNDLFYQVSHYYLNSPVRTGFIHVPRLQNGPEDAGPYMSATDITKGLTAALETLL